MDWTSLLMSWMSSLKKWDPLNIAFVAISVVAFFVIRDLYRAGRERKRIRSALTDWRSSMKKTGRPKPSDSLATWVPDIHTSADDIVTRAIKTVFVNRNSEPDLEALSTVLSQGEASKLAFARAAPNMMFLCGLGGTALGIMFAIKDLFDYPTSRLASEEFTKNLNQVLASVSSAFLATILGILSALIFAVIVISATKAQSDLLGEVQEFILTYVAPVVIPPRDDQGLRGLKAAIETLGEGLVRVPQDLARIYQQLEDSLSQTSSKIVASLEAAEQIATKTSTSAEQVALASEALQESTKALKESHDQLGALHERILIEFAETRKTIDGGVERTIANLEAATKIHLDVMERSARSFSDSSAETAAQLASAVEKISEVSATIDKLLEHLEGQAEEVWQRVGVRIEDLMKRAQEVFVSYKERVEDIETSLTQGLNRLHADFNNILNRLTPQLWPTEEWQKVRESLSTTASAMKEFIVQLGALQTAHEAINRLTSAIEGLEGSLGGSAVGQPQTVKPWEAPVLSTEKIEGLLGQIEGLLGKIERQLGVIIPARFEIMGKPLQPVSRQSGPQERSESASPPARTIVSKLRDWFRKLLRKPRRRN